MGQANGAVDRLEERRKNRAFCHCPPGERPQDLQVRPRIDCLASNKSAAMRLGLTLSLMIVPKR